MYFSFSSKKLYTIATVIGILFVFVVITVFAKTSLYGETPYHQIFSRGFMNEWQTFRYSLRGVTSASAVTYGQEEAKDNVATAIPVLTYHAIIPSKDSADVNPESFEGHNVGLKEFEDQMFTLKENGWETITLKQFQDFMKNGTPLPKKSFLLTFDDGSKDSYYPVDPLLKVLGFEAVTFILPNFADGGGTHYYLSESEIARALRSGRWEVGSHGDNAHIFVEVDTAGKQGPALANRQWLKDQNRLETFDEYNARIRNDFMNSQTKLESMFQVPVRSYAFPFGEFGQLSMNVDDAPDVLTGAASDVYDHIFYQWWPGEGFTYNYRESHKTMMKRISVRPDWTGEQLLEFLEQGLPKNLPYTDAFDTDNGWLNTWGSHTIEDSLLTIEAVGSETGASVVLDGTKHWKDYTATLEVDSLTQTGVFTFVRYQDTENFAACNLGNGFAHVEQTVNGEHRVIKGNRSEGLIIPAAPFTVEVSVKGRMVSCSFNGQVLVETSFLDEKLGYGGIGIKAWDKDPGESRLILDNLSVTESNEN